MDKLLVATFNQGKLEEYKLIFKELGLNIDLVSPQDFNIKEKPEENGKTFKENAIIKANFYYERAKIPTLADDGGIEIDYLNGEPGVKSRRWPGHEASDDELIEMILEKLKGVPKEKRGAQLRAVIALIFPRDEKTHIFEGVLRGVIGNKSTIRKIAGYPFRSVFYLPEIDKNLADLSVEEEAHIAHRKKAMEKALPLLKHKLLQI